MPGTSGGPGGGRGGDGGQESDNVNNLAYFSRKPEVTTPKVQNPIPETTYNASKTYMSFVMGDGDNVGFLKGSRRAWLQERVTKCEAGEGCFPLLWSMSPHVLHLSPDWLDWYYNMTFTTGQDYFVLPPVRKCLSEPCDKLVTHAGMHGRVTDDTVFTNRRATGFELRFNQRHHPSTVCKQCHCGRQHK